MSDHLFRLEGKTIVQFGGTGLLGEELRNTLWQSGANLLVVSRTSGQSPAPRTEATAEAPGKISYEQVDLHSEASLQELCARITAAHGAIAGVVYNAVSRPMRSYDDALEHWRLSMETNATGLFAALRIFGDAMAARRAGSIVNIASQMGSVGVNPWLYEGTTTAAPPDYFFHKAGMINLTRYLASHYGPSGVRVNAISPGGIRNPAHPPAPEFLRRYNAMTMLGRMAEATEICAVVAFLLSDASSYITGANLAVDGGYTAK